MLYLVSYDIPDTKRRTKISKTLKDFGDRVQYSVFECLLEEDLLEKMTALLKKIVDEKEDSVRIYTMCGRCCQSISILGLGEVSKEENYYIL